MKPADKKPPMSSSGVAVRLQGYGGARRQHASPWRRLGAVVLIGMAVAVTAVFRHLSHGSGEGQPMAATRPTGASEVSKPEPAPAVPTSVSPQAISTDLAVRTESAAPAAAPPRADGSGVSTGASGTTTRPLTKAAKDGVVAGPAPKATAGSSGHGDPPTLYGGSGRRYHVQVGAFADKAPAEELAGRLRGLGYAVRIVGARPFLVRVGGYLDEPTAARLVSHLRGQGFDAVMNPGGTSPL